MARKNDGFFESILDLADRIGQATLAGRLSKWGELAVCLFWDFLVDIPLRILSWPLDFLMPGVVHLARSGLDFALTFIGVMVLGREGLLQILEGIWSLIPGVDWVLDLIPMLTVGWYVKYRGTAGEEEEVNNSGRFQSPVAKGGSMMVGFAVGALVGIVGWFVGLLSMWQGVTTTVVVGALVALSALLGLSGQGWWKPVTGGAATLFALLCLWFVLGASSESSKSLDSFRESAWGVLVEEDDPMLKAARVADKAGKVLGAEGIVEGAKEGVGKVVTPALDALKGFVRDRYKGPKDGFLGRLLEEKPASPSPAPGAPTPPAPPVAEEKVEEAIPLPSSLKLGPMEARLYRSDRLLELAKEGREEEAQRKKKLAFGFFLPALSFFLLFVTALSSGGPVFTPVARQDDEEPVFGKREDDNAV